MAQSAVRSILDLFMFGRGSATPAPAVLTITVPMLAPATWRLVKFRDDRDYDLWLAGLSPLNAEGSPQEVLAIQRNEDRFAAQEKRTTSAGQT